MTLSPVMMRAQKAIDSCKTTPQLWTARKFAYLAFKSEEDKQQNTILIGWYNRLIRTVSYKVYKMTKEERITEKDIQK